MQARCLSADARRLRNFLIDRLWVDGAFGYVDANCFLGVCPICGAPVEVHFHDFAPRATLGCQQGCTEDEIAAELGLRVRP